MCRTRFPSGAVRRAKREIRESIIDGVRVKGRSERSDFERRTRRGSWRRESGGSGTLSLPFLLFLAVAEQQECRYAGSGCHTDDDCALVARNEAQHSAAVHRAQKCEGRVADSPTDRQGSQESPTRILRRSGHHEERNHRRWRRKKRCRNDRTESPAPEDAFDLLHFVAGNSALELVLSLFLGKTVRQVTANEGTNGRHRGVVGPPFMLARGQDDGKRIHTSGHGHEGIVQDPQENQPWPSQMAQPVQDTVGKTAPTVGGNE